jgi:putative transposase
MIDKDDKLPVIRQCDLLNLSRSGVYYTPAPISEKDRELMRQIDEIHIAYPFYGSRKIRNELLAKGFCYLVAVMDRASRMALSWRLSNTLDGSFCVDALEEAIAKYGCPEIFNTDQGSQFTAEAFTGPLRSNGIAISMDGKDRWMDNVLIERLWKSLKYEDIYLKPYASMAEMKEGLAAYFGFYNERRWHQNFDRKTPAMVYGKTLPQKQVAA